MHSCERKAVGVRRVNSKVTEPLVNAEVAAPFVFVYIDHVRVFPMSNVLRCVAHTAPSAIDASVGNGTENAINAPLETNSARESYARSLDQRS